MGIFVNATDVIPIDYENIYLPENESNNPIPGLEPETVNGDICIIENSLHGWKENLKILPVGLHIAIQSPEIRTIYILFGFFR